MGCRSSIANQIDEGTAPQGDNKRVAAKVSGRDRRLDATERPERPLPSGRVSVLGASILAAGLFVVGVGSAALVSLTSGAIAIAIVLLVLLYDSWGKHHLAIGPLNMGLCRGANLLLGVSLVPTMVQQWWMLAVVPILYIAAIALVSRGEVQGGNRASGLVGAGLYALAIAALLWLGEWRWALVPFLALLIARIAPPLWRAIATPTPQAIRVAVKAGVLSLIVLDAAIAASFGEIAFGLSILCLLPISLGIARKFAVT